MMKMVEKQTILLVLLVLLISCAREQPPARPAVQTAIEQPPFQLIQPKPVEVQPPAQPVVQPEVKPQPQSEYICSYNAYNCDAFNTHAEAQKVFEACGGTGNDIHHLDRDADGLACETLP